MDSVAALSAAQIVVEAVPEDLGPEGRGSSPSWTASCPPDDILATNTSTLSITEIAAHTHAPTA